MNRYIKEGIIQAGKPEPHMQNKAVAGRNMWGGGDMCGVDLCSPLSAAFPLFLAAKVEMFTAVAIKYKVCCLMTQGEILSMHKRGWELRSTQAGEGQSLLRMRGGYNWKGALEII